MASTSSTTKTKAATRKATAANTTARTSRSSAATAPHERDPKVIAVDSLYAGVGLGAEALRLARGLPERLQQAPDRVRSLADRQALARQREELEQRLGRGVGALRERVEQSFDARATAGRTVADEVLSSAQVRALREQARTARSQVKAAVTSIRRTASRSAAAGLETGRTQADIARSQTKGAVTSLRKTAATAVDAGRDLAG